MLFITYAHPSVDTTQKTLITPKLCPHQLFGLHLCTIKEEMSNEIGRFNWHICQFNNFLSLFRLLCLKKLFCHMSHLNWPISSDICHTTAIPISPNWYNFLQYPTLKYTNNSPKLLLQVKLYEVINALSITNVLSGWENGAAWYNIISIIFKVWLFIGKFFFNGLPMLTEDVMSWLARLKMCWAGWLDLNSQTEWSTMPVHFSRKKQVIKIFVAINFTFTLNDKSIVKVDYWLIDCSYKQVIFKWWILSTEEAYLVMVYQENHTLRLGLYIKLS